MLGLGKRIELTLWNCTILNVDIHSTYMYTPPVTVCFCIVSPSTLGVTDVSSVLVATHISSLTD